MTTENKRAVALVRVSSEEQARGGYGLEFQEQDIRAFCERNKFEVVKVFRDEGYSGATADRPGFVEMMEWARDQRFDVLVVWKLDRLFRNTKLTLQTVDELAPLGIEVRSVQESFTHDSNGRFLLTIFAAGAEKERRDIALRMAAGRLAAAKNGTWVAGGGTPPYGYRYDPDTKRLVIDEEEAPLVRDLFRWLINEKLSLYKIQLRLNKLHVPTKFDRLKRKTQSGSTHWWAKRTVGRILSNEVYQGTFTFHKYTRPGLVHGPKNLRPQEEWVVIKTPPIISSDTFAKAQEQLRENSEKSPRRTSNTYLLRGLLICGHDNRRMQATSRPVDRLRDCKYYFCSGTRMGVAATRCPARSVTESRIAPPIWDRLKELLTDPNVVAKQFSEYRKQRVKPAEVVQLISSLEIERRNITERNQRLIELYLGAAVNKAFFHRETLRLKQEGNRIERELEHAKGVSLTQEETAARARSLQQLHSIYKNKIVKASDDIKRELLNTFVKSVVVRGDELEIEVRLPEPLASAGQSFQRLSHKDTFPPIFLRATLVPISEVFRQRELHKNFYRRQLRNHN